MKNHMKIFTVLLLFAISSFYAHQNCYANEVLNINVSTFDFPPMFYKTPSGKLSGNIGETINEILKTANIEYNLSIFPVARSYMNADRGKFDILITAHHDRFLKSSTASSWGHPWTAGIFSKLPLSEIPNNEQELIGKEIIIINDWQSPYKIYKHLDSLIASKKITVLRPNSINSAIRMFDIGRAPLLWGSDNFYWNFNLLGIDYQSLNYKPLVTTPIVLWVAKKIT
ncbi:MAG: hypothetical protein D6B28_11780 [Gammaproteobacteria bacterium]|nr:MAG: hypothetical protein D6B28_11780 [Gammaproteobacteria bacterium]